MFVFMHQGQENIAMSVRKTGVSPVGVHYGDLKKKEEETISDQKKAKSYRWKEMMYLIVVKTWGGRQQGQFVGTIGTRT